MNLILIMFTALTLNANGLRDPCKWTELWSEINRTDTICIQETHLDTNQEFAFCLYAQGYDYFFSHGMTASAGVLVVVRCSGYQVVKVGEIPGHMIALDIQDTRGAVWLIGVYAPSDPRSCANFLLKVQDHFT